MEQTLDLAVILSSPPPDASAHVLARITVTCAALKHTYSGDLLPDLLADEERDNLY